jgi:hercynine metabolism protein
MRSGGSWLEDLEARLEAQLESFLRANPEQEALLADQEARDRRQRLRQERLRLRQEAEGLRGELLRLAGEIQQWQARVERAKAAGAEDLAGRARAHIGELMAQGRARWQTLAELGQRNADLERRLDDLPAPTPGATPAAAAGGDGAGRLESDWADFEARQELEELRRSMDRGRGRAS